MNHLVGNEKLEQCLNPGMGHVPPPFLLQLQLIMKAVDDGGCATRTGCMEPERSLSSIDLKRISQDNLNFKKEKANTILSAMLRNDLLCSY